MSNKELFVILFVCGMVSVCLLYTVPPNHKLSDAVELVAAPSKAPTPRFTKVYQEGPFVVMRDAYDTPGRCFLVGSYGSIYGPVPCRSPE